MIRSPSPAPDIPGYRLIDLIAQGGFADVFLYHQVGLERNVAIKVLLASTSAQDVRERFRTEARLMARLAEHQNIVPVYDAGIAGDGRPYLIMQFCPKDDLGKRYRTSRFSVPEVLSIGVQLAGAVESAHRQGIMHRDIKPANVLVKRNNRPALSDFGISVTGGAIHDPDAVGVSIPWSPPELLAADPTGDARSDVYSLAATLYTLLANRSPFEVRGQANLQADMISRISRLPVPPTGRPDTPAELERLLRKGLAKEPRARFSSALDLAGALQRVEKHVGGTFTGVELLDEDPRAAWAELPPEQAERTRVRPIVIRAQQAENAEATGDQGNPQLPNVTRVREPRATSGPASWVPNVTSDQGTGGSVALTDDHTAIRGSVAPDRSYLDADHPSAPPAPDTVVAARSTISAGEVVQHYPRRWPTIVGASVCIVGLAGGLAWILFTRGVEPPPAPPSQQTGASSAMIAVVDGVIPPPANLRGTPSAGGAVFTWTDPDPQPGDTFDWRRADLGPNQPFTRVETTAVTVVGAQDACIEVVTVRDDGRFSASAAEACTGAP